MNAGIAQQFKERFEDVDVLKAQNKKLTEIAFLKKNNQWILYLVTKCAYNDKPTYEDIFNTLINLKVFCINQSIYNLGLPKVCSGLWNYYIPYHIFLDVSLPLRRNIVQLN